MEDPTALSAAIALAVEEGSEKAFAWLAQQLEQTTDIATMLRIAGALRDARQAEYMPLVVAKLTLPATRGYRGRLVYTCLDCDNFDCTPYFALFVSLALHDTYHTSWLARDLLGELHLADVPDADVAHATREVEQYVRTQGGSEKHDGARRLLAFLRKHQKRRNKTL